MKEDINIYNHFHNGDIFYARVLINGLVEKYNVNFYHNLSSPLLSDMDGVSEISGVPHHFDIHMNDLQNRNVNSWIGQQNMIFVNTQIPGCSFENYFHLVKIILNHYNLEINPNEEYYLPTVNYEKILNYESVSRRMSEIKSKYNKIILISNGNVNSGQAINVDLSGAIVALANNNPSSLFLTTTPINHNHPNIIDTSSLTNANPDLLQISLISTFCDIIVGRASGPYCYTHTKENLLNPNKTYISFSNNPNEGVWYKNSKAKQIWSPDFNLNNIFITINNEINNL
jgi:hypothetical protein